MLIKLQTDKEQKLEVYTLGQFLVKRGGEMLSEDANRSYKLWEVFKYLLTNRQQSFHPEMLMETLWPEQDYADAKRALRSLVHRLRHCVGEGKAPPVILSQGCYTWNKNLDYWLDAEEFEILTQKAQLMTEDNPAEAVNLYQRAFSLYKGDYLPDSSYSEWVEPIRNYYQRLYLQSALKLTELLQNLHRYSELIKVCEKVFLNDPFEEEFHLRFLLALLHEAKTNQARAHYEYVTSVFYREMGVKPSAAMRAIYRTIQRNSGRVELDLTLIQNGLQERQETKGAFLSDPDIFRYIYKLERSRAERTGQAVLLVLLSFTCPDYGSPPQKELKEAMDRLQEVLVDKLRVGDVISCWNEAQFLLLLPGLKSSQAEMVLKRIRDNFKSQCFKNIVLRSKNQPLMPPNSYMSD